MRRTLIGLLIVLPVIVGCDKYYKYRLSNEESSAFRSIPNSDHWYEKTIDGIHIQVMLYRILAHPDLVISLTSHREDTVFYPINTIRMRKNKISYKWNTARINNKSVDSTFVCRLSPQDSVKIYYVPKHPQSASANDTIFADLGRFIFSGTIDSIPLGLVGFVQVPD